MTKIVKISKKKLFIYLFVIIICSFLSVILIHSLRNGYDYETIISNIRGVEDGYYENVLMISCTSTHAKINMYGTVRKIVAKGIDENLKNVLCNIKVVKGKIVSIDLKLDIITGKVLSVSPDYIDIEGYGRVPLEENFLMYDIEREDSVSDEKDLIVGYSLQNFVVAEGKICGAVKERKMDAANIRVMIMTSGYKSLFHDTVTISSAEGFSVNNDEQKKHYNGGEEVTILRTDDIVNGKRIRIVPDGTNTLIIKTVHRSQGNPEYTGILEVENYDEGLVIVNDVNIEDYISRVIPSEMPESFGIEALKVQAVCARSYAYKELANSNYSIYGAHVDDSVSYQVYNNTQISDVANQAAADTRGQLLVYKDEVVQTYYYSTSCGVTSDVSLWGSDKEKYPYYSSVSVGDETHDVDFSDEDDFYNFITNVYDSDYDREFPLYRWNMTVDIKTLSDSISQKSGCDIGNIQDIYVNMRAGGGAAYTVTVVGDINTLDIEKESDIRIMFGNGNVDINTQNGIARYERLPSAFIAFQKNFDENGSLTSYTIYGGGYGHGIGMSQNAVKKMSQNMDYVSILKFFYKGTEIKTF